MQIVPAHSIIGPSKSHRWINCPGSIAASEGCPDSCSDAASLGTAAHSLGEMTIERGLRSPRFWDYPDKIEGKTGKLHEVDEEMLDAVEVYTSYIFDSGGENCEVTVEKRFHLPHVHPELFGTNDCMVFDLMECLHVTDYKHGSGMYVEIVHGDYDLVVSGLESVVFYPKIEDVNPQLLIYALGGLESTADPFHRVKLTVVQPRCDAEFVIRSVILNAQDIREWGEGFLKTAAAKCFDENPEYKIGAWCKFCPAIACPAKLEKAFGLVKANPLKDKVITFPLPQELTPEELLAINTFADNFKTWADEVKGFIRQQLETGRMTSKELGLKLVEGRKSKKWNENYKTVLTSDGILTKEELYNEPTPKSPAQMDKLLKEEHGFSAKEREAMLKPCYSEQPGGSRLVSVTDKAAELKPKAEIAFQQFDKELKD